jgi:hypothetical protein
MLEKPQGFKNIFELILFTACIAGLSTLTSCTSSSESMSPSKTEAPQTQIQEKPIENPPISIYDLSQDINLSSIANHSTQRYNLPNQLSVVVSHLSPSVFTVELFSPDYTQYNIICGNEKLPATATPFGQPVKIEEAESFRIERGY